jgi:hypothetical protein
VLVVMNVLEPTQLHASRYVFRMNVSALDASGVAKASNFESVTVRVNPSQLVASVAGGDRLIYREEGLILDGSLSYDPDFVLDASASIQPLDRPSINDTDLVFSWACVFSSSLRPCFHLSVATSVFGSGSTRVANITKDHLEDTELLGEGYLFTLVVSKSDGARVNQASALINTVSVPVPNIGVQALATPKHAPQSSITLDAVLLDEGAQGKFAYVPFLVVRILLCSLLMNTPLQLATMISCGSASQATST